MALSDLPFLMVIGAGIVAIAVGSPMAVAAGAVLVLSSVYGLFEGAGQWILPRFEVPVIGSDADSLSLVLGGTPVSSVPCQCISQVEVLAVCREHSKLAFLDKGGRVAAVWEMPPTEARWTASALSRRGFPVERHSRTLEARRRWDSISSV